MKAGEKNHVGYVSCANAKINCHDFATIAIAKFPLLELLVLVSTLTVQGKWADSLRQLRRFSKEKHSSEIPRLRRAKDVFGT